MSWDEVQWQDTHPRSTLEKTSNLSLSGMQIFCERNCRSIWARLSWDNPAWGIPNRQWILIRVQLGLVDRQVYFAQTWRVVTLWLQLWQCGWQALAYSIREIHEPPNWKSLDTSAFPSHWLLPLEYHPACPCPYGKGPAKFDKRFLHYRHCSGWPLHHGSYWGIKPIHTCPEVK